MKTKMHYEKVNGNTYKKVVDGYTQPSAYTYYHGNRTMVKNK